MLQDEAKRVRQRIYIDHETWFSAAETNPNLDLIQQAVWEDELVVMKYQHGDGTLATRTVEAYALVAKSGSWYLLGRPLDLEKAELRTYRVGRILEIHLSGQKFQRPPDFDLPAFWAQSTATFATRLPRYPVRLRAVPASLARLRSGDQYTHVEDEGPPDAAGWVTLTLVFQRPDAAREYLPGFGAQVEVLEPVALRAELLGAAREIVALYATPGDAPSAPVDQIAPVDQLPKLPQLPSCHHCPFRTSRSTTSCPAQGAASSRGAPPGSVPPACACPSRARYHSTWNVPGAALRSRRSRAVFAGSTRAWMPVAEALGW
jgi:hypothetical protein